MHNERYPPDEVAEPKHQNTHTSELHRIRETALETLHQRRKHGCQSQRAHSLRKRRHGRSRYAGAFPKRVPVQRVVRVVAWLWNEYRFAGALDEMMCADIRHDLCAWQDLRVELLLDLADLLLWVSDLKVVSMVAQYTLRFDSMMD
jgi:transposase